MEAKKIQLPREVHIGSNLIEKTGEICKDLRINGKILVLSGQHTLKIAGEDVVSSLENYGYDVGSLVANGATMENVDKIASYAKGFSLIIGVGGGKVIDLAKMASTKNGIYFISLPTTASHDGIASPLASIKDADGSHSLKSQAPIGVIADTGIIAESPSKLLSSGCADIISNYTAIKDWQLAKNLNKDGYSESAAALSIMSAKLIIENANRIKPNNEESARLVVKNLFSSGVAISIAGNSRPASGSEHMFSHSLDKLLPKPALHGHQCGVGSIMMMSLQGGNWKCIRDALKKLNAPTNAKELGIDPEYIIEALIMAKNIRKERYTILSEKSLNKKEAIDLATKTEVI